MQCTSCGTMVPQGARHCPNCGALITPPATPPPNFDTFQETALASPDYQHGVPGRGTDPYNPAPPQQSQPPVFPSSYGQTEADMTVPQVPFPPAQLQGQQNYYQGMQPPYMSPLPPQLSPSSPRRGLSRSMVVLIAVIALLVMASGVGLIYYSTVFHPNQLHAQATATAQTAQTAAAQATSIANTQATGTAVAQANASATANAQATAVVVATQTALQDIYTSATHGTPAINDSLSGNTGRNWDVDQAQGGGGCGFSGGAYHASLDAKGFYFPCIAENTHFTNFAFQVDMNIDKGDAGGLIFRGNGNNSQFYVLQIGNDGSYDLFLAKNRTQNSDLLFGTSTAYKQGQRNLIAVVARGSNIYIFINKQYTGSVTDSTYSSGQIGVLVNDHTNPTDVAYTNAQVWTL
jgi:hypothetical protein